MPAFVAFVGEVRSSVLVAMEQSVATLFPTLVIWPAFNVYGLSSRFSC